MKGDSRCDNCGASLSEGHVWRNRDRTFCQSCYFANVMPWRRGPNDHQGVPEGVPSGTPTVAQASLDGLSEEPTTCPFCAEVISAQAKKCKHCGEWLDQNGRQPAARARNGTGLWGLDKKASGCLILLVVFVSCQVIGSLASRPEDEVTAAGQRCNDYVLVQLKAPSTASFAPTEDTRARTTTLGPGRYRVISWVDAENGFGAKVRTNYTCDIVKSAGKDAWQLESLNY